MKMNEQIKMNNDPKFMPMDVTPQMAKDWIEKCNLINRPVRSSHVKHLARQMELGRWSNETPQPIVFTIDGILLDGQHRLLALIMANKVVRFQVATVKNDSVFRYLDQGANRSNSDITGLHSSICGPIQYLLRCMNVQKPTPADIEEYLNTPLMTNAKIAHEVIKPKHRNFKSMPFRASFCIAAGSGLVDPEECAKAFLDLGSLNVENFTPMMKDIYQQFDYGFPKQDGRSLNNEFFMRGMFLFLNIDDKRRTNVRIYDSFRKKAKHITTKLMREWKS